MKKSLLNFSLHTPSYRPALCRGVGMTRSAFCLAVVFLLFSAFAWAQDPAEQDFKPAPPSPAYQSLEAATAKSEGCVSCHLETDAKTMHENPAVVLGCTDCHGGDADVYLNGPYQQGSDKYRELLKQAHVLPRYPERWNWPSSANPKRSYTLLNKEHPAFIRFINPGDLRVAEKSCGACHGDIVHAAKRSLMATTAMFWGGGSYNNGILPFKRYILGEAYTRSGEPAMLHAPVKPNANMTAKGILPRLYPAPKWASAPPADIFRVFERGGRNISNLFPETGLPNLIPNIQRLEEPGRPDIKQSNRGPGTGSRIAVPVLNLLKTRLNGPNMWFLGTNDQPGDYRSSGCSSCHVVYANDRDPVHSGRYGKFGHWGETQTVDPTIAHNERGHPLKHQFTRAIPTSQCMSCHMHQPNMFLNSFLGYTMWDYESDAPFMWPDEQRYPTAEEIHAVNERNPEAAAPRGLWGDLEFLGKVADLNPKLNDTQFADYHGHGWVFRAIFKRDRKGHLLDTDGDIVSNTDPKKFKKAVHMRSIHAEKGMHCVDCHYAQDNHGNGHIYGEVAAAVEIQCIDCHGTADSYPALLTSGPAAPPGGHDFSILRTPDGRQRFEWINGELYQRSMLDPTLQWKVSLVKDTVTPGNEAYNKAAARAKLMSENVNTQRWGQNVAPANRAHKVTEMMCTTCHTSWTTSCSGCHLPIEVNRKTDRLHYEGGETRNFATYNPQVNRADMFMLGVQGAVKGHRIAPTRSSSALVLSSTNANREHIYTQQAPISAAGFSSQAFATHFPHTVRREETKRCEDCHISKRNDNNAIMAQLLMQGTGWVNFIGYHAYIGSAGGVAAVQVTEWKEPQAVIGSYLQKYAYPDWYAEHQENEQELARGYHHDSGRVACLQLRGEYLYAATGEDGFQVYDVASIANKGFSQRIITAPYSELGHDMQVETENATCMALPTNQPIHPDRNKGGLMRVVNQEQAFHPIYNYAAIVDSEEGLILVDINTLADGEPRNNFLQRALTWNKNGILNGAQYVLFGGHYLYVLTNAQLVILNLDDPLQPKVAGTIDLNDPRGAHLQFRYLFVVDADGMKVINVTRPEQPQLVEDSLIPLKNAQRIYVARTYAYIAAAQQGLVIVDVTRPEHPRLYQTFTANGRLNDARDVVVGASYASLFAYVADGKNGLKVIQLMSPASQPNFYGFSPEPKPELIAWYDTPEPALSMSRGLERDRAVDETGHQIAVFGRIGSRPFNAEEMKNLYWDESQELWKVHNTKETEKDRK